MSRWLWALVLLLCADAAQAQDNRFLLINGTSYPIRELALSPRDLNDWRVCRTEDGQYLLEARRTLVDEIFETSERAALRKFLYGMDLPDTINVANIHIERLDEPETDLAGEAAA